jgi:putative aldouronate transport system substrate-binding protein
MKKTLLVALLVLVSLSFPLFGAGVKETSGGPIAFSAFYSDNATLPFKHDWLTVTEVQKRVNAKVEFEVIPIVDYQTKVSLALNTGTNAPDVILYQSTKGENAALSLNGAIVPISDYEAWTPNFNARVKEFGLEDDVDALKLKDGKRYYLPALFDVPFYDGGLILREDLLKKYNLAPPKTFEDLYQVLKVFKQHDPSSYPLTILAGPRVLYRMTMPSWGISLGKNSSSGSNTLSWDYANKRYFAGAISEQYKSYITYLRKLYAEGLLDPEMAELQTAQFPVSNCKCIRPSKVLQEPTTNPRARPGRESCSRSKRPSVPISSNWSESWTRCSSPRRTPSFGAWVLKG